MSAVYNIRFNNKVVYELTLLQYIRTLYYYMYIFYLQPMMTGLSMVNGLAMLQASISISLCRNADIRY